MTKKYENKYIRVRINKEDLSLNEEDSNIDIIKEWIEIGRKYKKADRNSSLLTKKIDELEDKVDRLVKMLGLYAHHNFMSTQLLKLPEHTNEKQKSEYERDRIITSHKIRHSFFPEFRIPSWEKDLDTWLALHKAQEKSHEC